ncbi:MAG: hypothetical protein HY278_07240 [candidate division NC10 bacterium]|nr:hypothetical protein [candidate division NC10 bacterium]
MQFSRAKSPAVLFLSLSLLAWMGASSAWAQRPTAEPGTVLLNPEGVVNVQDLPRVGPRVPVHREMPFRVPDLQELVDTKARHQAATQPAPSASAGVTTSALTTPSTTTSLMGLRRSESGGWIPPDTQVGVGPSYIVEAVNLEMRIWNRTTGEVTTSDLNSFFGTSAQLSDPKIRFDPLSNRWFIAVISYNTSFTAGAWRVAVSTGPDPFSFIRYTASTSKSAPDFPALGISADKVILTANAFRGNSFLGTEFLVINKANLTAGTNATSSYFAPPQGLFTIQPAHSLSSTATLYMAAVAYNSATSIRVWSVNGVPGVGAGVTRSTKDVPITSLTSPPDARQAGTSTLIQTNDNRLLDAAYRNDVLWVSANSACVPLGDTTTRACLRLIQLSIGSSITKTQDFDFGQSGSYYYYPAVQIDGNGNLISVFSGSSASLWAGVYASGQRPADGPNTFQLPATIKFGENAYKPFANRWGDYSCASIDPSNSATIWVAGEYAHIEGGSEWGTWIAPLQMLPPSPSP